MSLSKIENLYLEGQFKDSLSYYKELPGVKNHDAYYFNLGTLYAKTESYVQARYYLEKSLSQEAYASKADKNLEFVLEKLQLLDEPQSFSSAQQWMIQLQRVDKEVLLVPFLLFLLLLTMLKGRVVRWGSFIAMMIIGSFFYLSSENGKKTYFVMDLAAVREGPSSVYPQLGEAQAGRRILISDIRDSWVYIEQPQQLNGWIEKSKIKGLFDEK
jgi:tetratricopeptide (TPR) repeat protein